MDDNSVADCVMWLSLERFVEKFVVLSEVNFSREELFEVVWLFAMDEEAVTVPTKVVATAREAAVLACRSPAVSVP